MALDVVVGSKSSHDIKNRPSSDEKTDVHVDQMKVRNNRIHRMHKVQLEDDDGCRRA